MGTIKVTTVQILESEYLDLLERHKILKSFEDWKQILKNQIIEDEYGEKYSLKQFINIVNELQNKKVKLISMVYVLLKMTIIMNFVNIIFHRRIINVI